MATTKAEIVPTASPSTYKPSWHVKYTGFVIVFTLIIFIFSLIMAAVADSRSELGSEAYTDVSMMYAGELRQSAPSVNKINQDSVNYNYYGLNEERVKTFTNNTNLVSSVGKVKILADFVKKGLVYQPTYRTEFSADYVLHNKLNEKSVVSFEFPFPSDTNQREISNAKLVVNGTEQQNTKATVSGVPGLKWEGEVPANGDLTVSISYSTVGLSRFTYEGFENASGSQDFDFQLSIEGTRQYDVLTGLSVDRREFGDNATTLIWQKDALYSQPVVSVAVGDKLNPGSQVSRVYITMAPLYVMFIFALIFTAHKFGRDMRLVDVGIISTLFAIFFPFFHYLASFTVDPTIEIFSRMNVGSYSMPLYSAFAWAFIIVVGIVSYLLMRTQGKRFAFKLGLPLLALAFGFFPLVATVPEYFGLLSLIGLILVMILVIQARLKLESA